MMDKATLRKEILQKRETLTREERREKSAMIMERLLALPEYQAARSVFIYADFRSEVMTRDLIAHAIKHGKRVLASRTLVSEKRLALADILDPERDLVPGYMGIPEPRDGIFRDIPCEEVDLVLTPCVGYDEKGNRLGYGAGYYDRLFESMREDAIRIGLAFEVQIALDIPSENHDVKIPIIVTEDRVIRT
ncbi:MAG: 5-formyltetrahydrofolate cyclo-ligase [bacterium]